MKMAGAFQKTNAGGMKMKGLLALALLAGIADAWLPNGRVSACARMTLGLMMVRSVCHLAAGVFALWK